MIRDVFCLYVRQTEAVRSLEVSLDLPNPLTAGFVCQSGYNAFWVGINITVVCVLVEEVLLVCANGFTLHGTNGCSFVLNLAVE